MEKLEVLAEVENKEKVSLSVYHWLKQEQWVKRKEHLQLEGSEEKIQIQKEEVRLKMYLLIEKRKRSHDKIKRYIRI